MSMELIIKTPEDAFLKAVEFNYAELKTAIENSLEKYKGLTYDDNQVAEAKKDRSTLNKFKESMENERKRVKKLCMRAYEESFEPKVKELVALVNAPINEIDTQVKAFEDKKKEIKLDLIRQFWLEHNHDIKAIVSFEKIFSEKWLNVSTSMKSIEDEILSTIDRVKQDMETLKTVKSDYYEQMLCNYMDTLDIGSALRYGNELEEKAKRLAEYEKQKAQEMPKNESSEPAEKPEVKVFQIGFRVTATAEQLQGLKQYLSANNIKYERI